MSGQLSPQMTEKVKQLKQVFPGKADEDLIYALEYANGDKEAAVTFLLERTCTPIHIRPFLFFSSFFFLQRPHNPPIEKRRKAKIERVNMK